MWNPRETFDSTVCQSTSGLEVLQAGGLAGWNPQMKPTYVLIDGEPIELPTSRAVVATTPAGVRVVGDAV